MLVRADSDQMRARATLLFSAILSLCCIYSPAGAADSRAAAVAPLAASAAPISATPASILISADRVWTGAGQPHADWAVLVAQGKIVAVGPADKMDIPGDAQRISLSGATLIPGLMDLHSHVLLHPYNETSWDAGPRLFIATRAIVATGSYGPSPRSYRADVDRHP